MLVLIDKVIIYGVVAMQVFGVLLLFALIQAKVSKFANVVTTFASKYSILLATFILSASVAGSLYYSVVLGYDPCVLCWYQRILIYPQLIIFAIAIWKKRTDVWQYTVPMSVIGLLVALYHNFLPYFESVGLGCGSSGPSCSKLYVFAFGYLTIPVMSLTVFAILIILSITNNVTRQNESV